MDIENGIASVSTVSRLLKEIDEEMFLYVFMEWISELLDTREKHIIIDGKALRGAAEKSRGGTAPYILNVVDAASQMVILHLPIGEKGNEAAHIPRLLDLLDKENTGIVFSKNTISHIKDFLRILGKQMHLFQY